MNTGELLGVIPPQPGTIVPRSLEIGVKDYTARRVKLDAVAVKVRTDAVMQRCVWMGYLSPDLGSHLRFPLA